MCKLDEVDNVTYIDITFNYRGKKYAKRLLIEEIESLGTVEDQLNEVLLDTVFYSWKKSILQIIEDKNG